MEAAKLESKNRKRLSGKWRTFLKDVLICSLGAYGGPAAHYGVFAEQMVKRKGYLSEEELVELVALNSILPGPTSTQTIVSIGYKTGGPKLALLTMLVWALPVLVMMTALSFLYEILARLNISQDGLRFVGPMAVGFIIVAAYRIGLKVIKGRMTLALMIFGAMTTYFVRTAWIFPAVLLVGAAVSVMMTGEKNIWNHVKLSPPWRYLIVFTVFALGSLVADALTTDRIIDLFESFYRYGYLVFGGGQVVIPVMHAELVQTSGYMTNQEFLTGYGLVQGLPGPMFSFSAYAGGMAARGESMLYHIAGSLAGGMGIFMPGLLLIYFVYPVWENLKKIKAVKIALTGINAVAGGLIAASAVILMQKSGLSPENITVTAVSAILLFTGKVPAPLIVLASLIAGFAF